MSFTQGLGAAYFINTPIGKQRIDIPIEDMARDAAAAAIPALTAQLPGIIQQTTPVLVDTVKKEIPKLVPEIGKQLPNLIKQAKPQIQDVVDEVTAPIKLQAAIGVLTMVGAVVLAARWTRNGKFF